MKIIIACGGSGGHLFPGIAVAEELKKTDRDCRILLVGSRREVDVKILKDAGLPFVLFPACPMPQKVSLKCIPFFFILLRSLAMSLFLLLKIRPDAVLGFGGFVSGPVLLCASFLRIPVIIHEQNVKPGRANLMVSRFAGAVAVSFEESEELFGQKDKVIVTGNPVRGTLLKVDRKTAGAMFGFTPEKFTIFVLGGSQGAASINRSLIGALGLLSPEVRNEFQAIHISGKGDLEAVKNGYKELGIKSSVYDFLGRVDYAYCASDLIISRAGASAVSEILFFGKTAILIPYPHAMSHQLSNARYLEKQNMAVLLEEDKYLTESLYKKVLYFYNNRNTIGRQAGRGGKELSAAAKLAELTLNLKKDGKD